MSRGLVTGIYYAVIVLLLAVPWALGHFFNVVVSNQLIIILFAFVLSFNPFVFMLYSEKRGSEEAGHQGGDSQTAAELARQVALLKQANQQLEIKERAIQAKDLELTLANRRLEKLDQAKSEFVSVTTHQLRTPLAAIKWTFHMIKNGEFGPVTPDQKTFLEKGYESAEHVIAIVNDLLNVDYIEANKDEYKFIPTDLVNLIDKIVVEFNTRAREKGVTLSIKKPSSVMPAVELDPIKISVVVENLVDNALKYTRKEGQVTVEINDDKMNSARPAVEVVVTDSGIGIPPGDQPKIFQRFFRSPSAVKVVTDGSGLGLFIAKDIVENHGGEIWFASKENEGTQFHFTLPQHPTPK
jgi:signal transduction histidine kinase